MATIGGKKYEIVGVEKDAIDEQILRLTDGLFVQFKYDVCNNTTTALGFNYYGEILTKMEIPEKGNFVGSQRMMLVQILATDKPVEEIGKRALEVDKTLRELGLINANKNDAATSALEEAEESPVYEAFESKPQDDLREDATANLAI